MDQKAHLRQRYDALSDGCIRLLSLQPATDRRARINCTLAGSKITDRPYEALSYVWGQEEPSHSILVNGEEVLVRPNLHAALEHLRLANQPRTLWVDSICINQSDISERNSQVKQMGLIFSSATQVLVWLGAGDSDTYAAIDFIQGLSRLDATTATSIDNNILQLQDRTKVFRALGMVHGPDNYHELVGGLVKLMDNAWWKRIWTVQEIVLSKSAKLICGTKSASWSYLSKLSAFALQVSHHNAVTPFGRPMDEAIFDEITGQVLKLYVAVAVLDDLSYAILHGSDISLEQISWLQLLSRQATDPRDMIYALLGLSTERNMINIDYNQSKKQVYISAMKTMLQCHHAGLGPLRFLQECSHERDPDLPSWVPDFGIIHSNKTTNLAVSGIGASLVMKSLYNASFGDTHFPPPKFHENDAVLELEGVLVDQVQSLGAICPRFPQDWASREAQLRNVLDQWLEMIPKGEKTYVGGGSFIEAFWRTVTFDLSLTDRDYLAGNPDRRDRRLPESSSGMPPTTTEEEAELRAGILDAPIPKTVLEKLGGRRFFVTREGYFGLGPASLQAGDVACVLRGGLFPTLVRTLNHNRYTMVGECFVHGIMDGEIVERINKGESSWQSFFFI